MATLEIDNKVFEVDGDGFLAKPEIWTKEVASLIAKSDGIEEMNDKHWAIVNIIRKNFEEKGKFLKKEDGEDDCLLPSIAACAFASNVEFYWEH